MLLLFMLEVFVVAQEKPIKRLVSGAGDVSWSDSDSWDPAGVSTEEDLVIIDNPLRRLIADEPVEIVSETKWLKGELHGDFTIARTVTLTLQNLDGAYSASHQLSGTITNQGTVVIQWNCLDCSWALSTKLLAYKQTHETSIQQRQWLSHHWEQAIECSSINLQIPNAKWSKIRPVCSPPIAPVR